MTKLNPYKNVISKDIQTILDKKCRSTDGKLFWYIGAITIVNILIGLAFQFFHVHL